MIPLPCRIIAEDRPNRLFSFLISDARSRAVYGMAGKLPDRGAIGDVLRGYQEVVMDSA